MQCLSFGIETLCVTGSCEFNIYMSPEARKSELRQIATAQHAEAHLTAVSKQVSEGFGILGAAMTKFGALTESELQQLKIAPSVSQVSTASPSTVAVASSTAAMMSSEQCERLIAQLQRLNQLPSSPAQQRSTAVCASPAFESTPTAAQVTHTAESPLVQPQSSKRRRIVGGSATGATKKQKPCASEAGPGEKLPDMSTLEKCVQAYNVLSSADAKARFTDVPRATLNAARCRAKCFHQAVERRKSGGMSLHEACLNIVQMQREDATQVRHGNLTSLFLQMTRERQTMCAYAEHLAIATLGPSGPNEDRDIRNKTYHELQSLCKRLFGSDHGVRKTAMADLSTYTKEQGASLKPVNKRLWT